MEQDHPNYRADKRTYPLNEDEMFPMKQPLFPRRILQPLYELFVRNYAPSDNPNASDFMMFLLRQTMEPNDEREYAISKGKVLEKFQPEFYKRFKHHETYVACAELLIRGADPYAIIQKLIEVNDEQYRKIHELIELMPPLRKPK